MSKGRDAKGLTFSLRTILRLHIELLDAYDAGDRIGEPPTLKEAASSPHVVEQIAYLDLLGRELLARFKNDEDEIRTHLEEMLEADSASIDKLRENTSKCSSCGRALCSNCQVCHSCEDVDEHTRPKKGSLPN